MKYRSFLLIAALIVSGLSASAQDERPSSSMFLKTQATVSTTVPFYLQDPGKQLPVRWGMDVAWMNEQNMRKGINHIGKADITIVRGSFRTKDALVNDSVLTTDQVNTLQERIRLARIVSDTVEIILNEDQEAGIDSWYGSRGNTNTRHWAQMIDAHVKWIQTKFPKLKVVAISPFNEPDYSNWGQGSIANLKEISRLLKEEFPRFKNIAITAGNTLNCDQALNWYNGVKPYVDWGNTHQLAGSFDNYANFFKRVTSDGKYGYADELHNVGEAMVGAEYGMKAGVWWGFDSRARGEFCHISNHGSRIGYAENRGAWTSASVYRDDETGEVKAFLGSSERQANTSTFLFVSRDREVYYDGQGPQREFRIEVPGGTGYQNGQTNAERVIDVVSGEDVPPSVINGQYKIMNRATNGVIAQNGVMNGQTNISQMSYSGKTQQQWNVEPVSSRIGGDYSFLKITSVNDGRYLNVLNNSTSAANVIAYNAGCASNEQWYLVYAGNGFYYIKNRESGLYLELATKSNANGTNIRQNRFGTTDAARLLQQWRFLPLDAPCEQNAPAAPTALSAKGKQASVALEWNANTEEDLVGYMILRAEAATGEWNTIARNVKQTHYIDNTCRQGVEYIYKVRAFDYSENLSQCSEVATATASGEKGLVANWQFEDNLQDNTDNWFDALHSSTATFTDEHKSGERALNITSGYVRLPYQVGDMDEMTIALWVNWQNSTSNWTRIFDFGNGTDEYMFLTPSNGSIMRFAIKNGGDEQQVDCKSRLSARVWKHVAVTMGKDKVSIFIDGEEVASNANVTLRPRDIRPALNYIARSQFSNDPGFRGYVDDLRIYNYAMTADELKAVMEDSTSDIRQTLNEQTTETYYDLNGIKQNSPQRGVNILKATDGKSHKVIQ